MSHRKPKRRCYRLRQRRERQGMTQLELGQLVDSRLRWPAQWLGMLERVDAGEAVPHSYSADRIQAVRRTLLDLETSKRHRREELRREGERVAFQRSLWAALPDHPAIRALKAAMLDRCLDLMHEGSGEECDAIAEFLPDADVERMFDQWEREVAQATAEWEARHAPPPAAEQSELLPQQLEVTND